MTAPMSEPPRMRLCLSEDWQDGIPNVRVRWPKGWSPRMVAAAEEAANQAMFDTVNRYVDREHIDLRMTGNVRPYFYRENQCTIHVPTDLPDHTWRFTFSAGYPTDWVPGFEPWARVVASDRRGAILIPVVLMVNDGSATLECLGVHR